MNDYHSFESVGAWQVARAFKNKIYEISKIFPMEEKYCLIQQIRRAAISMTANIAEGYGRYSYKDNIQFCIISRGSLLEVIDHLYTALDQNYITKEKFDELYKEARNVEWKINGYINFLKDNQEELKIIKE